MSDNLQPESTGKKWVITNSTNVHWLRERLSANLVLHPLGEAAAMYSGLSSPLYILTRGFGLQFVGHFLAAFLLSFQVVIDPLPNR